MGTMSFLVVAILDAILTSSYSTIISSGHHHDFEDLPTKINKNLFWGAVCKLDPPFYQTFREIFLFCHFVCNIT